MKPAMLPLLLALCGCQTQPDSLLFGPGLTPVGHGLAATPAPLPATLSGPQARAPHAYWDDDSRSLFRDIRANRVGDVVTVLISINDQAQFDNQTGRSRVSGEKFGLEAALEYIGFGVGLRAGNIAGKGNINSQTSTRGEGKIDRAEKLRLSIAAVVTDVLPNGNLVIRGSQEVRVNFEVRVLEIGGIVRPLDVASNNTVAYDKIAETRISYGGRGRLTDVQQPAIGQRVYDVIAPF